MFAPQHPDQYQSWKATSEQSAREDALAEDPRLVILWAGYPFSRDYNKPRGHAYAVTDVRETLRTGAPKRRKTARCRWPAGVVKPRCRAPYPTRRRRRLLPWQMGARRPEIVNDLGCADCHNTASDDFAQREASVNVVAPLCRTGDGGYRQTV